MNTPKRLYEVLPPEKRMIESLKVTDLLAKTLVLHSATTSTAANVVYAKLTVSVPPSPVQYYVTVNQEQITSIISYLLEVNAFPVLVKFVTSGKSYALVDPEEYGSKPAPTSNPPDQTTDKEQPK